MSKLHDFFEICAGEMMREVLHYASTVPKDEKKDVVQSNEVRRKEKLFFTWKMTHKSFGTSKVLPS